MGDTPDFVNGEPEPIRNDGPSMHDLVIGDIRDMLKAGVIGSVNLANEIIAEVASRKEFGFKKYGTILQAHNGRNALQDAIEEHVDQLIYLRQAITETIDSGESNKMLISLYQQAVTYSITLRYLIEQQKPLKMRTKKRSC